MTATAGDGARVLVAATRREAADSVVGQLEDEFAALHMSIDPARAAQDFVSYEPDIVVLAFDDLAGARRYCASLQQTMNDPLPVHRTVILCSRAECATVAERCRQREFDDYVLYWPQPYDGFRLAMSIRIACRELAAGRSRQRLPSEFFEQARHVDELDRILDVELDDADQQANGMKESLASTEREIERAVDDFSGRLDDGRSTDWMSRDDRDLFSGEIGRLKARQIEVARRQVAQQIVALRARARQLKDRLEPSLAGARSLVDGLRKLRPVVMVVEDDEFARELVARTLDPQFWDAVFASDGDDAMSQLRNLRPDVILMDIRLPGIDGLSLTHRLKASPHLATIPVIVMTGDARKETLVNSVAAGAAGFVVKPFTRAVLNAKLEKLFPR